MDIFLWKSSVWFYILPILKQTHNFLSSFFWAIRSALKVSPDDWSAECEEGRPWSDASWNATEITVKSFDCKGQPLAWLPGYFVCYCYVCSRGHWVQDWFLEQWSVSSWIAGEGNGWLPGGGERGGVIQERLNDRSPSLTWLHDVRGRSGQGWGYRRERGQHVLAMLGAWTRGWQQTEVIKQDGWPAFMIIINNVSMALYKCDNILTILTFRESEL